MRQWAKRNGRCKAMNMSPVSIRWVLRAGMVAAAAACLSAPGKAKADETFTRLPQKFATAAADRVQNLALMMIGIPYRFGGSVPESGFDCSGLVAYVFRSVHQLEVGRRTAEIARTGTFVHREELLPGDLVFFNTLGRANSHVGVYLGDGRFVHAPARGGTVRVDSMEATYWRGRFDQARRVVS